jgi:eukaryotic-like serine/threonine-protein kinase
VSTSSSAKRGKFWRTDWFVGAVVVAVVLVLHQASDVIGTMERRFYDYASTQSSRQPSDRIAVIAIDDQSIANIGRWPWPRDVHAQLIDQLAAAKAKTIVHTTFFFEPQTDRGLVFIKKIKEALAPAGEPSPGSVAEQLSKVIAEAEQTLDTDAKLAASMTKAGNVLIPSVFVLGEPQGKPDKGLPAYFAKTAIDENNGFSYPAVRGQYPLDIFGNAAGGVGHLNQLNDVDGAIRDEPLLINYYGKAIPSMPLLAAARSLNLGPADIKLNAGDSVQLGKLRVKTDEGARMLPQFYKSRDGKPAFAIDSFYDILGGKIPATKYADKIVIIGATAQGVAPHSPLPATRPFRPPR